MEQESETSKAFAVIALHDDSLASRRICVAEQSPQKS
jgi:hypothetical protein